MNQGLINDEIFDSLEKNGSQKDIRIPKKYEVCSQKYFP